MLFACCSSKSSLFGSRPCSETTVMICVPFTPTRLCCLFTAYGSVLLRCIFLARSTPGLGRLTQHTYSYRRSEQKQRTVCCSRANTQNVNVNCHLIKYNVIIHSPSISPSQVSLYGPPLNQHCQDNLHRTSNLPLYQSHVYKSPSRASTYSTMPG